MKKYSFETYHSRKDTGSIKWNMMYKKKPDVAEDVVPMTVADMDFLCCKKIREGLSDFVENEIFGYSVPTRSYYEAVINFYKREYDLGLEKDWFVTSPGIVTALFTAVRALTEKDDGIIVLTPIYPPFYRAIENQGRRVEACPLINKNNHYEIDFDLFEDLAKKATSKMFMLCSPHNPGGRVWTRKELEKIDRICEENNLIVVSDEIHCDIVMKDNVHTPYFKVSDHARSTSVMATSASKSFNIAGLKNSNIFIADEKMREDFSKEMENVGLHGTNALGLKATELAYDNSDQWLNKMKEVIGRNQKLVEDFFDKHEDYFILMPAESTFLAWVDYRKTGMDEDEFMAFLEEEAEFFVNPGSMFGEDARGFIRINLGLPTFKLEENLNRLEKAIEKLEGQI